MKKSYLALLLAVTMVIGLLAGCGSQSSTSTASTTASTAASAADSTSAASDQDTKEPIKPFKIGFPFLSTSTDPSFVAITNGVKAACEAAGGELVEDNWDFTPDGLVTSVQKLISMGVNGILIIPPADSVLPTIMKMCEDAKVPFGISFRSINDPDIKAAVEASPMYAGNCYEDEESTAYTAIKKMGELGVKNLAVLSVAKGDTTGDARDRGIEKAAKEAGIKVLTETRGLSQATDVTKAVESFVAAYPEMDGIFISAATTADILPATMKVLEGHNLTGKVKVGRIDFDNTMTDYLKSGELSVIYGGHFQIDTMFAMTILVNKVIGTPVSDKPASIKIKLLPLTTYDEAQNFSKYVQGDVPLYTIDELKQNFIKYYNSSVTADTFQKAADEFSLDSVMQRHKDLIK